MTPFPVEPARALGPMRIVLSAYPSREAALAAVDGALDRRLAACASVVAADSRYWWRGRVETASESIVLFKTVPKRVGALVAFLTTSHPYDVPEVVELDVPRVAPAYLTYLARTLGATSPELPPVPRPRRRAVRRARGARALVRTRAPHRPPSR